MIKARKAEDRGSFDFGWLDTRHTFSFGDYYDPAHMGFRTLRVINEDRVKPGEGFGTHPHRDMEIISYVLEGGLQHRDSMGNGSVIRPGDVQRMTAGTGVLHSEFNASKTQPVHFLQIWILPNRRGLAPSWEQKRLDPAEHVGQFRVVASPDGRDGSVSVHQDVILWSGVVKEGQTSALPIAEGRHSWVQVARGAVVLNGEALGAGDGAAISGEREVSVRATRDAEVLVFDLA
ncbi:MAG: pirin family protein [Myxococcaceae bacterium]